MPTFPAARLSWLTYLAAGAAGWGMVALFCSDPPLPPSLSNESPGRGTRGVGIIPTGAEILARLETGWKATEGAAEYNINDNLRAKIAKRLAELPHSGDPGAEAIAAIARLGDLKTMSGDTILLEENLEKRIEIAALFHRWLESDPQAALDYANALPEDSIAYLTSGAGYGVEFWGESADPAKLRALVLERPDKITSVFLSKVLGRRTGESGDFAAFAERYEEMTSNREGFSDGVGKSWPVERVGELVSFAMEHKDLALLGNCLRRMKTEDVVAWFDKALEAGGKDTGIDQFIMNYGDNFREDHREELGLEGTIALRERFFRLTGNTEYARVNAERNVASTEVRKVMGDPGFRDLIQSFTEGKVDAATVLDAVETAGPELAAAYPDLVRDHVLNALVRRNPAAAAKLLADLPEPERYQKVNTMANYTIGETPDPQRVYELFEAAPHTPEQGPGAMRESLWSSLSAKSYSIYGDDYLDWLKQLPPGANRDMGIEAMAGQLQKTDPAKAAALRAQAAQK